MLIRSSRTAEDLLLALGSQLQSYSTANAITNGQNLVESETNARKELNSCRERLLKLESLLGPDGNAELAQLAEKLAEREEKDKILEAKLKSQDHVSFSFWIFEGC